MASLITCNEIQLKTVLKKVFLKKKCSFATDLFICSEIRRTVVMMCVPHVRRRPHHSLNAAFFSCLKQLFETLHNLTLGIGSFNLQYIPESSYNVFQAYSEQQSVLCCSPWVTCTMQAHLLWRCRRRLLQGHGHPWVQFGLRSALVLSPSCS
jgi:hypothetical protein